jgi:hypothetical protein
VFVGHVPFATAIFTSRRALALNQNFPKANGALDGVAQNLWRNMITPWNLTSGDNVAVRFHRSHRKELEHIRSHSEPRIYAFIKEYCSAFGLEETANAL